MAHSLIAGVTVNDVPSGNGFALTDSNDVIASDLTTSNNAWGGFAIYTYGRYFSLGSDNITIQGTNSFGEFNKVYVERGNFNAPGSPQPVTNLTVNGFDYTVMNDTHRASGENFTYYQITQADAIAFALALATPIDSYVNEIATGDFWVGQNLIVTMSLQAAIQHAIGGETVHVLDGTYPEINQLVIDKDLIIVGESEAGTIIQPTANTGTSGNGRGWWLVEGGNTLTLSNMTLDGNGFLIWQAIRHLGGGSVDHVTLTDIRYQASASPYQGTGLAIFGNSTVNVTNSTFSQIGRIGIQFFGAGVSGSTASGNTYTGKGAGDWLDYGIEVGAGAQVTITDNNISGNRGVAASDGSISAGILVSTFFGAGTEATITQNILTDNTLGIAVGYNNSDTSVVIAHQNDIAGNEDGVYTTAPLVNATLNFWGDPSGPSGEGSGSGDSVSTNVVFCPWLTDSINGAPVASGGASAHNVNTGEYFCSIQEAIDDPDTVPGHTIEVDAGTFNEQVEINKDNLTLQGAGPDQTLLVSPDACTNTMNSSATAGVRLIGDHTGITLSGFSVSGYDLGLDIGENIGKTITDVTVSNVNASNNCVHGILSQAGTTNGVSISNVTANDNGFGFFAGRGIWMINGTKSAVSITDSTVNDNRLVGIDISDGDVTGLTISGNTVIGNGDSGIGVLGPQGPDANVVSNNTVTDNGRYGIEIKNPSGTTSVSGNIVSLTGAGSDTRDYAGIAVFRRGPGATNADQPSGVSVTGNTVTGFVEPNGDGEGFGIVVEGTGISVTGNTVTNNDVGIQVQEGNPSPNTNGTDFFDRGDASVVADANVNNNDIIGNTVGVRAVGTTNITDGTLNWWGDASGPSGEGTGTGDSVSTNVAFCPWLDDSIANSPMATSASGGIATTSTDGHTTPYCTIEEAMFASSGANQEVHVTEGNWAGEVMTRDYSDSPDLLVIATGNRANTVVNGMYLTGSSFAGLTFDNFTITGDAPTVSGYDPGYAVEITNSGTYANLAFVNNVFDGENVEDAAAIFSNRGWDGFLLDNNSFINFNDSPLTPLTDGYYANFSLVFMEAQVYTPAGRGNNFVATNNTFEGITHLNAIEAFRWQNVNMTGNIITGTFGRLMVWSYNTDPLVSVNIANNNLTLSSGNDVNTSTGIGVYYADADVNITGNTVNGANTCINTNGVTDLEVTGNNLNDCATRGHLYSDSDFDGAGGDAPYIAPVSAVIQGNTFNTSPNGVENQAQTFELDACDNIFIAIGERRFENPGPFAPCNGSLTVVKEAAPNAANVNFDFELYDDDNAASYDTFTLNGSNNGTDNVEVFDSLPEGNYTISETNHPNNWEFASLTCDGVDYETDGASASFFVNFDDEITCVFRNERRGQVRITKFEDLNGNGVQDQDEPDVEGWEMFIYQEQGDDNFVQIQNNNPRYTNASGIVNYNSLVAGTYRVCEEDMAGWTNSNDNTFAFDGHICQEIEVVNAQTNAVNFANMQNGTVTIFKATNPENASWLDFGFDGDFGDFDLNGGTNSATNSTTFSNVAPFDENTVTEVDYPGNWDMTGITCESDATDAPEFSVDGESVSIVLTQSNENMTCTFTNERRGQVRITKFDDVSEDGIFDNGESTLEGWQMFIYQEQGDDNFVPIQNNNPHPTNASGIVNFNNLVSGTYRVCEEDRAGWANTQLGESTFEFDGLICQDVEVEYGQTLPVFFGNIRETGNVTVTKYHDLSTDGRRTADEPRLDGWEIIVYDDNGNEVISGITGDFRLGRVRFYDLPTGDYTVCETMQAGWINTNRGNNFYDNGNGQVCRDIHVNADRNTGVSFANYELPPVSDTCGAVAFVSFDQGLMKNGGTVPESRSHPSMAFGAPQNNDTINFVSLGFDGELVLRLDGIVTDDNGGDDDLFFIETSFGNETPASYPETVEIYGALALSDGWTYLGMITLDGGVDFPGTDMDVLFVRLVDVSDPNDFSSSVADGYDLDGIQCDEPNGEIVVTKVVDWNGADVDEDQEFTLCVNGDNLEEPLCDDVNYDGGSVSFDVAPGEYSVYEYDPGDEWTVAGQRPVTVSAGETESVTITNTHDEPEPENGRIVVTKIVNDAPDNFDGSFTICVSGGDLAQPLCYAVGATGGQLSWDLPAGSYLITENYPGANWEVHGNEHPVDLAEGETETHTITNIYNAPPPPVEQVGTIRVTKNVVTPPAEHGDFTICISNAVFPAGQDQPACYNVHNNGDQVSWNVVIPQNQNSVSVVISENPPGANWSVDGSGASVTVRPNETTYHTITNTYNAPPPPTCDGATGPQSDLIGWITINGGEAVGYVQNVGNVVGCVYPIGLASYNMYDENIDTQTIFAASVDGARAIQPGETVELRVALPQCAAQVDLFYGDLISPMFNGNRYGSRLLAYAFANRGNYCQVPVVEPPQQEQPPIEEEQPPVEEEQPPVEDQQPPVEEDQPPVEDTP
ncbi:MAG: right-handed parallel beta-helix repeat-containing protein [Aggregatilineales bacterium]